METDEVAVAVPPIEERISSDALIHTITALGEAVYIQLTDPLRVLSSGLVRACGFVYRPPVYGRFGSRAQGSIKITEASIITCERSKVGHILEEINASRVVLQEHQAQTHREEQEQKKYIQQSLSKDRMLYIEESAEIVYPGRWELKELRSIEYKPYDNAIYRFTVHFPKVTIENGFNTHEVTDLYAQIYLTQDYEFCGSGLFGTRGTITPDEYNCGYTHSHLSSSNKGKWSTFCVGSGTPIHTVLSGLAVDRWNNEAFFSLLLQIQGYVSWESLEGGPYIKMTQIGSNGSMSDPLPRLEEDDLEFKYLYKNIVLNLDSFYCEVDDIQNASEFIIPVDNEDLLETINANTQSHLLVKQYPNGTIRPSSHNSSGAPSNSSIAHMNEALPKNRAATIVFKGDTGYTKVELLEEVQEDEDFEINEYKTE